MLKADEAARGVKQSAYQVLVASSADALQKDQGDLWDSGKVQSDAMNQIVYVGQPLRSRMQCWWKVRTWNGGIRRLRRKSTLRLPTRRRTI